MKSIVLGILLLCSVKGFSQANVTADLTIADSLFVKAEYAKSISHYQDYIKKQANSVISPMVFNKLGFAYHNIGKWNDAIENYNRVVNSSSPQQLKALVLFRMAKSYAAQNENEKAIELLQNASEAGFQNIKEWNLSKEFTTLSAIPSYKRIYRQLELKIFPCLANEAYSEFDFWIGEWNVYDSRSNQIVGTNKIQKQEGGCSILEKWEDRFGREHGSSLTFYNPTEKKWEQIYIGSGGQITHYKNGIFKDKKLVFEYKNSPALSNKPEIQGRFIFKKNDDGSVQQYQEESSDSMKTWQTIFDFVYRRK